MTQNLLILLGVLIILTVLMIWNYPWLHILLTRLLFGKLSPRYFEVYKKYTGKRPFQHCIKDDLLNYIAPFFDRRKEKPLFVSRNNITFGKVPFGISFQEVYRSIPNPFCINAVQLKTFYFRVLGYRSEMFEHEMKSFYFFINDRFVMGMHNFKSPSDARVQEITQIIRKKYLDQADPQSEDFLIEGANKVRLHFQNTGFHISLKYLDYNQQDIIELLDDYWSQSIHKGFHLEDLDFEEEYLSKL